MRVKLYAGVLVGIMALACLSCRGEESVSNLISQAEVSLKEGHSADAEPLFRRALAIHARARGTNIVDAITSLKLFKNLAVLYYQRGAYAEAAPMFEYALKYTEAFYGPKHPETLIIVNGLAISDIATGAYVKAEPLFRRAIAIQEELYGTNHLYVANSLFNLALTHISQGRESEAEPLLHRALMIREKAVGTNSVEVADVLRSMGIVEVNKGRYAEAESVRKRILEIQNKSFPEDEPAIAAALTELAQVYTIQGRYKDAELLLHRAVLMGRRETNSKTRKTASTLAYTLNAMGCVKLNQGDYKGSEDYFTESMNIRESQNGRDNPLDKACLVSLGELYLQQKRFAEAESVLRRVKVIQENIPGGAEQTFQATILSDLGLVYHMKYRFAEAESLFKQALAIRSKALGLEHPHLAPILSNMAVLFLDQWRYKEADELSQRAIAILEKKLGPEHPDLVQPLSQSITILIAQGRYKEAEVTIKRLLSIQEKTFGQESRSYAESLRRMADLYVQNDQFARAEPILRRALRIQETTLGSDHYDVADTLNSLAMNFNRQGFFAEAKALYEQALRVSSKALGPKNPAMATLLGNFAQLYADQGLYADALPLVQRALAIGEEEFGTDSPGIVSQLNTLAIIQSKQNKYDEAEQTYRRAMEIEAKVVGIDKPTYASLLNNIGDVFLAQGRIEEALTSEKRALEVFEKVHGPNHTSVADALMNLSGYYSFAGRYESVVSLDQRALKIYEDSFGSKHSKTVKAIDNLATTYFAIGDDRALQTQVQAFEIQSQLLTSGFSSMSERQRMDFTGAKGMDSVSMACSVAMKCPKQRQQAISLGCLWTLRSKGLVLDSLIEDRLNLASKPDAVPVVEALREIKKSSAALQYKDVQHYSQEALAEYRALVESLNARQTELEQQLAQLAGNYLSGRRATLVTINDVRSALATNEVLLEFVRFFPLATTNEMQAGLTRMIKRNNNISNILFPAEYACFAVYPDSDQLEFVSLGSAEIIDRLISNCRDKMRKGENATALFRDLYDKVWSPIQSWSQGKKRVIISPDGELSFLSFSILMDPDGKFLIEGRDIGYVASGRDLIRQIDRTSTNLPALFGDPAFGVDEQAGDYLDRNVVFRSVFQEQTRSAMSGMRFLQLPGTRREVENLRALLQTSRITAEVYVGAEASEGKLKSLIRPEVLHLATHGFFLPDIKPVAATPLKIMSIGQRGSLEPPFTQFENPMLRSGLALTGAALALAKKSEIISAQDDGIVTAEEISSLNLWGTKLVVMSACDTGMGAARAGQGVMGLRRAFAQAGVKNILMTLWPVQDDETGQLMVDFYRKYLKTDDAIGAISAVQRAAIVKARENGEQPKPRLWGPFLVSVQGKTEPMKDK